MAIATATFTVGDERPTRPGYVLVGFAHRVFHKWAKRYIFPRKGKAFPIWKKAS
jgi:hypothetical protein